MPEPARIVVGADSTILEASEGALELLGLTLDELKALPPGALSIEEDKAASAAFETAWKDGGRGDIVGAGTIRLTSGELLRLRFLIAQRPDGTFDIVLERSDEAVGQPPRTYTMSGVLSAWRAAERTLAAVPPDSREWREAQAEIEHFRAEYQRMAREQAARSGPASAGSWG